MLPLPAVLPLRPGRKRRWPNHSAPLTIARTGPWSATRLGSLGAFGRSGKVGQRSIAGRRTGSHRLNRRASIAKVGLQMLKLSPLVTLAGATRQPLRPGAIAAVGPGVSVIFAGGSLDGWRGSPLGRGRTRGRTMGLVCCPSLGRSVWQGGFGAGGKSLKPVRVLILRVAVLCHGNLREPFT